MVELTAAYITFMVLIGLNLAVADVTGCMVLFASSARKVGGWCCLPPAHARRVGGAVCQQGGWEPAAESRVASWRNAAMLAILCLSSQEHLFPQLSSAGRASLCRLRMARYPGAPDFAPPARRPQVTVYRNPSYQGAAPEQQAPAATPRGKARSGLDSPGSSPRAAWLQRMLGPALAEDDVYICPSYLLASLLVAAYCTIYMFVSALQFFNPALRACLLDPGQCLHDQLSRHLSWQLGWLDTADASQVNSLLSRVLESEEVVRAAVNLLQQVIAWCGGRQDGGITGRCLLFFFHAKRQDGGATRKLPALLSRQGSRETCHHQKGFGAIIAKQLFC